MAVIATELAVSYVSIVPSLKGFQAPISRQLSQAEKSAANSGNAMGQKMGGSFASSLKKVVGPALAIFGAGQIAGFAKQAVGAFSELEDSTAAAGVVFGKNMQQIIDQSKTAAATMGLTQQQVINAANTFGTYGKAAGLSGKELANFATEQTQLAADMASFKGTSPEQAIEAIGAALRGEMEPIRTYGVLLDDASLRNEALAMGLISTTKDALTPQNKTLAAQALILKQTTDAQGDFARTSESTANVAKTLSAATADTSAKIGKVLAPAFTAVRTAALGAVSGVSGFLDRILAFQEGLTSGAMTPDLVKAIGLDPTKGFGRVVGEGIGSLRAFGSAWKRNDGDITSSGLAGYMEMLAPKIRTTLDTLTRVGKEVWATVGPALTSLGPPILNLIIALSPLGILLKALAPVLPDLAESAASLAVVLAGVLTGALTVLTPIISGIVSGLADLFSGLTSTEAGADGLKTALVAGAAIYATYKVATVASTVATKAKTIATGAATLAQKGLNLAMKANPIMLVVSLIAGLVAALVWFFTETETGKKIVTAAWTAIKLGIDVVVNWFRNTVVPWFTTAINVIKDQFTSFRDGVRDKFNFVKSLISRAWNDVIKPVFDKFGDIVRGIPGAFEAAKKGIKTAWDAIQEIAKKPVRFVVNTVINDGLIGTFNKIPGVNIPKVKLPRGFAKGGYATPGWAMVGEEGPELVNFSKPGRVYTAKETQRAMQPQAAPGANVFGGIPSFRGGEFNAIDDANAVRVLGDGASKSRWFLNQAAQMWNGLANVRLITNGPSASRSTPGIWAREGASQYGNILNGGWAGYYANSGITFNPAAAWMSAAQRRTVAVHEIGHALGLPHAMATGANSVMNYNTMYGLGRPTIADATALRAIYGRPGAGASSQLPDDVIDNPFSGLIDTLMAAFKKAFPGAGMFVDAAGGLAKSGIESVVKIVTDIQNGIRDLAGDIWGNIKSFFGGGSGEAALYDTGGWLMPNGGRPQLVQNKTGEPEAIFTQRQLTNMGGGGVTIQGNVGWDPDEVARRIEVARRRAETVAGLGGVVFA